MLRRIALLIVGIWLATAPAWALTPIIDRAAIRPLRDIDVVVVLGQSQSTGGRNSSAELPANLVTTDRSVRVYNRATNRLETLVNGVNGGQPTVMDVSYPTSWGPEAEFSRRWRADYPTRSLVWFKYNIGGARFASNPTAASNWTKGVSGGIYADALKAWGDFNQVMRNAGLRPRVVVVLTDIGWTTAADATESSNYEAAMTAWLAEVRRDFMAGGRAPILIARMQANGTYPNYATVRAAQLSIRNAASDVTLVSTDGYTVGADSVHFDGPGWVAGGREIYWSFRGLWYPKADIDNYPTSLYAAYDLRNTISSGAFATMKDLSGFSRDLGQSTSGFRPAQATTNGVVEADFDGSDDVLFATSSWLHAQASNGWFAGVRSAADDLATPFGEGASGSASPFVAYRMNASGDIQGFMRDDSSTAYVNNAALGATAYNGTMNALAVVDTGSQLTGYVNGTASSAFAYTRATTTLNRTSIGALVYGGGTILNAPPKFCELWTTASAPDSTYRGLARGYLQRECRTP